MIPDGFTAEGTIERLPKMLSNNPSGLFAASGDLLDGIAHFHLILRRGGGGWRKR
jgi:hypothetical protein